MISLVNFLLIPIGFLCNDSVMIRLRLSFGEVNTVLADHLSRVVPSIGNKVTNTFSTLSRGAKYGVEASTPKTAIS